MASSDPDIFLDPATTTGEPDSADVDAALDQVERTVDALAELTSADLAIDLPDTLGADMVDTLLDAPPPPTVDEFIDGESAAVRTPAITVEAEEPDGSVPPPESESDQPPSPRVARRDVAAPTEIEPVDPDHLFQPSRNTLESLDDDLAADVADLLDAADFESVDDVLDTAFDDDVMAATAPSMPEIGGEHQQPQGSDDPSVDIAATATETRQGMDLTDLSKEDIDDPVAEVPTPVDEPTASTPAVEAIPAEEVPATEFDVHHDDTEELPVSAAEPPAPEAAREPEATSNPLAHIAIEILRGINAPVRMLPPGTRGIVDILALTLVFWVPIVWLIVLFK